MVGSVMQKWSPPSFAYMPELTTQALANHSSMIAEIMMIAEIISYIRRLTPISPLRQRVAYGESIPKAT
jgi:hypothetical protein